MAAIADADVSINASGDIRWTGAATTNRHSVLEFIQWLMTKQDDEQAVGDDLLDITVDTSFDRSTDQIVALNSPFNIDDTFALHLYDGSVSQNSANDLYSGLGIIGPAEAGTEYQILQDGKKIAAFWGTGINAEDSPSLVFSRHLVKSRSGGADIDGRRITVMTRELNDQWRRFPVTLGTGSAVAAIGNGADIFNKKTDVTLAGYTSIVTTEGFQEINIDGSGAAGQEYYTQWDKGTQTINDSYERSKWIGQRSHTADTNVETGDDNIIDNATITGQGTEFSATSAGEILTGCRFRIKEGLGTPTGTLYAELYDSDDVGTAAPTGAVLARSEAILATHITTSYEDVLFQFNRLNPDTGADQLSGMTMVADQEYFIVVRNDEGTAGDYFHIEGDATSADDGNRAHDTGGWTGVATDALNFDLYSSPEIHGFPGDRFEGINIDVGFDGEGGVGVLENEVAFWGTEIVYGSLSGNFVPGEYVTIETGATLKAGGKVIYDNGSTTLVVSLDTLSAVTASDTITGLSSGATAAVSTFTHDDKSGGEGLVLAKDDNGVDGEIYLQVISGANPVENSKIYSQVTPLTNYCDATATITTRTLNPEFIGTSTGSNLIGAYGIGYDTNDVGSSDLFTSLDGNNNRQPPNNQTFTVSGLVSGEDRVLVGPRDGSALGRNQWELNTTLSGAGETAVVINTTPAGTPLESAIADDTPSTGKAADNPALRVLMDSGIYRYQDYESWSGSTFVILSSSYSGDNATAGAGANVWLAYIDVLADAATESFTAEYVSDRDLFVRVRDGGGTPIKTFESDSAQFLATPQTVAAVRTDDY